MKFEEFRTIMFFTFLGNTICRAVSFVLTNELVDHLLLTYDRPTSG